MQKIASIGVVLASTFLSVACEKQVNVGDGYSLVTIETSSSDSPKKDLQHNGKVIWRDISIGFLGEDASDFLHNGIFVFTSNRLSGSQSSQWPQVFATRGSGPPILLTERLIGQQVMPNGINPDGVPVGVSSITPCPGGIRVVCHSPDSPSMKGSPTFDLEWKIIEEFVREVESADITEEHNPIGDLRVLPRR